MHIILALKPGCYVNIPTTYIYKKQKNVPCQSLKNNKKQSAVQFNECYVSNFDIDIFAKLESYINIK